MQNVIYQQKVGNIIYSEIEVGRGVVQVYRDIRQLDELGNPMAVVLN